MNSRYLAMQVILKVREKGHTLDRALGELKMQGEDLALIQAMSYGVLRHYRMLESIIARFLKKPLKAKDQDVQVLLLLGLYQLRYLRTPDHAAMFETVAAVGKLKKAWAKGLVNGVLRSALRQKDTPLKNQPAAIMHSHPDWLYNALRAAWGEQSLAIMEANNAAPPMHLRVNQQKSTVADYLKKQMGANQAVFSHIGVTLDHPEQVERLHGFVEGTVSVQDVAAQQAVLLLEVENNMRVLDACAAPGGKTCHLFEVAPGAKVWALDASQKRLARLDQNRERIFQGQSIDLTIQAVDAVDIDSWWDGNTFDRILIDAPCSGTGVIRRHPDIKWLRDEKDLIPLLETQKQLLSALWPLLSSDGVLLYTTCSVLPVENEGQVARFCQAHPDAVTMPIDLPLGVKTAHGWQVFPEHQGPDGFFYAKLRKKG